MANSEGRSVVREPVSVIIYLENCKIQGTIYLSLGGRLSDFVNDPTVKFLPITDAFVEAIVPGQKWSYSTSFMELNKDYVLVVFPKDALKKKK